MFTVNVSFCKKKYMHYIAIGMPFFLTNCSTKSIDYTQETPEAIYSAAFDALDQKDYANAAYVFSELEKNYPYSDLSRDGQVLAAYALYLNQQYDESSEAFDVFIQLHPGHHMVSYAMYMRAMCAYDQIAIVERDQEMAIEALDIFQQLNQRFPKSKYFEDVKNKIALVQDHLAGKELSVGRFYLQNGSYLSAINRLKVVVEDYSQTNQVPEALFRLYESYLALGFDSQAMLYKEKLKKFNTSSWYKKLYN